MALTLALPLSGVEPEYFYAIGGRVMYNKGLKMLAGGGPISPSTDSVSSGIGSLTHSEYSQDSSRSSTPIAKENPGEICKESKPRILYKERDILNLGANIREPYWQMQRFKSWCCSDLWSSSHCTCSTINWALCRRLSDRISNEDYLTKICLDCSFCIPWPYIF